MLYIKSFNESITENIKSDLYLILAEIIDSGIDHLDLKVFDTEVSIYIECYVNDFFNNLSKEDAVESVERLNEYLLEKGYKFSKDSYVISERWEILVKCPNCDTILHDFNSVFSDPKFSNLDSDSEIKCGNCGFKDIYDEFLSDTHPITIGGLINYLKYKENFNIIELIYTKK